jgi:hypothetical protein
MASPSCSDYKRFKVSHTDEKNPMAALASGRGSSEEDALTTRERMTRLSDLEFVRILSRDPLCFEPYNVEASGGGRTESKVWLSLMLQYQTMSL